MFIEWMIWIIILTSTYFTYFLRKKHYFDKKKLSKTKGIKISTFTASGNSIMF